MHFPAHVPAAVRAQITTLIEGDSSEPFGLQEAYANAERQLARIESAIGTRIQLGDSESLNEFRKQKAQATEYRDSLKCNLDCLVRLANDPRMANAYAVLTGEFTDDKQWRNFIHAAWAARMDYQKFRARLKRSVELTAQIADAADNLANLIQQFSELGTNGPDEFYSIPLLLSHTDNHEMQGHNLHMWRSIRSYVLGDLPKRDVPETNRAEKSGDPFPVEIKRAIVKPGDRLEIDPVEKTRNQLLYAWGTAPEFAAMLGPLAKAARDFKLSESRMVEAAVASRQHSLKTEYLRAFGSLLTDVYKFALTTPIKKAIATVANVVINMHDVDVTNDDVRKALRDRG